MLFIYINQRLNNGEIMLDWKAFRPSMNTVNRLNEIERFHGNWQKNSRLKPALIIALKQTTIVTSAGASTRIEGALMSDKQVQELIDKGLETSNVSSRSAREVKGYVKTLTYIYEYFKDIHITEKEIRELHQLLTEDLNEDELPSKQRGCYKDIRNDVVEKNTETGEESLLMETAARGLETETLMRQLVESFQKAEADSVNPLIRISIFIVQFLAIHPFRDGNGRLSRLLTVLLTLKEYEWVQYVSHEKFIEDNKALYYISLKKSQESLKSNNPNLDPWIDFFTLIVSNQAEFISEKINSQDSHKHHFPKNEKFVVDFLQKNGPSSTAELSSKAGITAQGMKMLLARLKKQGVVELRGRGPSAVYFLK